MIQHATKGWNSFTWRKPNDVVIMAHRPSSSAPVPVCASKDQQAEDFWLFLGLWINSVPMLTQYAQTDIHLTTAFIIIFWFIYYLDLILSLAVTASKVPLLTPAAQLYTCSLTLKQHQGQEEEQTKAPSAELHPRLPILFPQRTSFPAFEALLKLTLLMSI